MLLALHAGSQNPSSSAIFKLLITELVEYDRKPLQIEFPNGRYERLYVRLLLTIADAPARADLLNHKAHNALYGCHLCYIQSLSMTRLKIEQ